MTLSYYTYGYDSINRVTTHTYSSAIGTFTYSDTKTYTYDSASQVTGDTGTGYSYDASGNRTTTGYATGSGNRMSNDGTFTYTYDAEGNLSTKSKGSGLEAWFYTWDSRNRLTNVRKTSDGTTTTLSVTYTYDATNLRVQEEKWQSGPGTTTTRFAWDGADLWADLNGSNTVVARYAYNTGVDSPLGRVVLSGANAGSAFYLTDNQGSVRDIQDGATAAIAYHADYSAFGGDTEHNSGVGDRLKYAGREVDLDTQMLFARARYYDLNTGRWLSEDPIGFRGGDRNLYRYVGNNTVNRTDPSGLVAKEPHWDYLWALSTIASNYGLYAIPPVKLNAAFPPWPLEGYFDVGRQTGYGDSAGWQVWEIADKTSMTANHIAGRQLLEVDVRTDWAIDQNVFVPLGVTKGKGIPSGSLEFTYPDGRKRLEWSETGPGLIGYQWTKLGNDDQRRLPPVLTVNTEKKFREFNLDPFKRPTPQAPQNVVPVPLPPQPWWPFPYIIPFWPIPGSPPQGPPAANPAAGAGAAAGKAAGFFGFIPLHILPARSDHWYSDIDRSA